MYALYKLLDIYICVCVCIRSNILQNHAYGMIGNWENVLRPAEEELEMMLELRKQKQSMGDRAQRFAKGQNLATPTSAHVNALLKLSLLIYYKLSN